MSNKKITDLPVLSSFSDDDVIPVVDVSANVTKKSYIQDLATRFSQGLQSLLISGTNIKTINSESILGSGNVSVQDTLVSGTNIKTVNSTSLLGSGDISISANPSGVAGSIQFSDGSAFSSDATNLFWDNTNKRLGVGTNAPTRQIDVVGSIAASNSISVGGLTLSSNFLWGQGSGIRLRVDTPSQGGVAVNTVPQSNVTTIIRGWGATSATNALLVQNSSGTELFRVRDDGQVVLGTDTDMRVTSGQQVTVRYNMSVGTLSAPVASARLQVDSTTQGFLPPRGTNAQMLAIASPSSGLIFYDSTNNKLNVFDGTSWVATH